MMAKRKKRRKKKSLSGKYVTNLNTLMAFMSFLVTLSCE